MQSFLYPTCIYDHFMNKLNNIILLGMDNFNNYTGYLGITRYLQQYRTVLIFLIPPNTTFKSSLLHGYHLFVLLTRFGVLPFVLQ